MLFLLALFDQQRRRVETQLVQTVLGDSAHFKSAFSSHDYHDDINEWSVALSLPYIHNCTTLMMVPRTSKPFWLTVTCSAVIFAFFTLNALQL